MTTINRRNFLITGGVAIAGLLYLPSCASRKKEEGFFRFFTNEEGVCVEALCEQIIPADENYGGATEAGVVIYIDRQLMGSFSDHAEAYRENLKMLQAYCEKEFGNEFQKLSSEDQIDVMKKMEQKQSSFFELILKHTMQGFYGSPIHGGNKDYMSFDMLGLEYPLNIGQNRYVKPLHEI